MGKSKKREGPKSETYDPVEEWVYAPDNFRGLPLKEGEYTVIVDPHTGIGLYLVAKLKNLLHYTAYLDGIQFKGNFKRITFVELNNRIKEKWKIPLTI